MRFLLLSLVLASACATAHPRGTANIPATRHQIDDTIASDLAGTRRTADFRYEAPSGARTDDLQLQSSRKITAMGRVTSDQAIVYTRPGAVTLEETWVRDAEGWKLARVTEVGRTARASASR